MTYHLVPVNYIFYIVICPSHCGGWANNLIFDITKSFKPLSKSFSLYSNLKATLTVGFKPANVNLLSKNLTS